MTHFGLLGSDSGIFVAVKETNAFFIIISVNSKKMINAIFLGHDNM